MSTTEPASQESDIAAVRIRTADGPRDLERLLAVREAVFVGEQEVPLELERDEWDARALHVLAVHPSAGVIATGRMLADGHIGRMAVLAAWRGRGLGTRLLHSLMAHAARRGLSEVYLHSQVRAIGFYERLGFAARGPEFMDAGIAHRAMFRLLAERRDAHRSP